MSNATLELAPITPASIVPEAVPNILSQPDPNANQDPILLLHERLLNKASDQLVGAGVQLEMGTRKNQEESHARASLAEFGTTLDGYISRRLTELEKDGGENFDIGQVVKEVDARVQQVYIGVIEQDGTGTKARGLINRLKVTRVGQAATALVGAALGFGASKAVGLGVGEMSGPVNDILSYAGTIGAGVFGTGVLKTATKFTQDVVGDKVQDKLSPFGEQAIESVNELERRSGVEFSLEEKVALARCAKVSQDTESLRNDMSAYIGERFMQTDESRITSPTEVSAALTDIAVEHIGSLLGIKIEKNPKIIKSFLGKMATKTVGLTISNISGNETIGDAAEHGAESLGNILTQKQH